MTNDSTSLRSTPTAPPAALKLGDVPSRNHQLVMMFVIVLTRNRRRSYENSAGRADKPQKNEPCNTTAHSSAQCCAYSRYKYRDIPLSPNFATLSAENYNSEEGRPAESLMTVVDRPTCAVHNAMFTVGFTHELCRWPFECLLVTTFSTSTWLLRVGPGQSWPSIDYSRGPWVIAVHQPKDREADPLPCFVWRT